MKLRPAFAARVAPDFTEVREEDPAYGFRAVAPKGVAIAVRAKRLDDAPQDAAFWKRTETLRVRELEGCGVVRPERYAPQMGPRAESSPSGMTRTASRSCTGYGSWFRASAYLLSKPEAPAIRWSGLRPRLT